MRWNTVAIAAAIAVVLLGAITVQSINGGSAGHASKAAVAQVAPLELMTKAGSLPVQASTEPF